jgi:hypothetical protein
MAMCCWLWVAVRCCGLPEYVWTRVESRANASKSRSKSVKTLAHQVTAPTFFMLSQGHAPIRRTAQGAEHVWPIGGQR